MAFTDKNAALEMYHIYFLIFLSKRNRKKEKNCEQFRNIGFQFESQDLNKLLITL